MKSAAANNVVVKLATASMLWLVVWSGTQGIFMSDVLLKLPGELNLKYVIATLWIALIAIISLIILPWYRKKIFPKSYLLWLYIIPAILLLILPQHYTLTLYYPVFVFMIIITVFWQDYVTFGLLQTYLATRVSPNVAAMITTALFLLGHVIFFLHDLADPQFVLIALAGGAFAFSRRYTGTIYVAHVLHLCFYLI
jgi:hypothetical protein